jgi:hypothetical protein
VLEHEGVFTDQWNPETNIYTFEGHDSVAEGAQGRLDDQLLMYASGKPTDNGKFYKAAHAYRDGLRPEPLPVQVYEKLDAGVWFDKGIFSLVDATYEKGNDGTRKVARFFLSPVDALLPLEERVSWTERMLPVSVKVQVWQRDDGRCSVCANESGLHFAIFDETITSVVLRCADHLAVATGIVVS